MLCLLKLYNFMLSVTCKYVICKDIPQKILYDFLQISSLIYRYTYIQNSNYSIQILINGIVNTIAREYIVDLMADPGTVIPSDTLGGLGGSNVDYEESLSSSPWSRDEDSSYAASSTSNLTTSSVDYMENNNNTHSSGLSQPIKSVLEPKKSLPQFPQKAYAHGRSPSWTEGISSPAVRKMKVNDVSQYMMEAAKENPKLAQKLHDVLLESGVVAPPDLFTQVYEEEPSKSPTDSQSEGQGQNQSSQPRLLPPLPRPQRASSQSEANPAEYMKSVPAAAAVAAAAVAMVAATKTMADQNIQLPVAAAATVTAAVMAATTTTSVLDSSPLREGDTETQYEIGQDGERISDRSTGNESTVSDVSLDDVADCEIVWEDITLGERIGLGTEFIFLFF